jgi:hypothetical protein
VPTISEFPNVYDSALDLLEKKGFQLWFDEKSDLFFAERNGWDFAAENPISLLGLVAIFEAEEPSQFHECWWRRKGIEPRAQLPKVPVPYDSIMKSRRA